MKGELVKWWVEIALVAAEDNGSDNVAAVTRAAVFCVLMCFVGGEVMMGLTWSAAGNSDGVDVGGNDGG
ncbi:hypothetical protein Tco_0974791 [Tanacetum coccineum]|uniref:Uncharacterized protein n=1 Tax=Tanacetum coccineum TaxID=301880 RepID=A0ABQ5ECI8_9ASTR